MLEPALYALAGRTVTESQVLRLLRMVCPKPRACTPATRLAAGTRCGRREAHAIGARRTISQSFAEPENTGTDAGGEPHSLPAKARHGDGDAETVTMDDHLALHPEDRPCPWCDGTGVTGESGGAARGLGIPVFDECPDCAGTGRLATT